MSFFSPPNWKSFWRQRSDFQLQRFWQIREQNLIVRFRSVHKHGRNRCDRYTLITKVKSKSYRSHWQKIFTSFYQYNKQMLQMFRLHFCFALMRIFSKNKNEKNCSANCTMVTLQCCCCTIIIRRFSWCLD